MASKPLVVQEAIVEELVKTNQRLTNVISKDSVLHTGVRFTNLSILSNVFSLLACKNCSTTTTLKLLDIEDKKSKEVQHLCKIKFRDCNFKHSFFTSPQTDSTKDNRSRGMKTMEINVRAVHGFRSIEVGHTTLIKLCGFLNMPPPMTKNA